MGLKDDRVAAIRKAAGERIQRRAADKAKVLTMAKEQHKTRRSFGTAGRGARMEDVSRDDVVNAIIEVIFDDSE